MDLCDGVTCPKALDREHLTRSVRRFGACVKGHQGSQRPDRQIVRFSQAQSADFLCRTHKR